MSQPRPIKLTEHEREAISELLASNPVDAPKPVAVYEWAGRARGLLQALRAKQIAADSTPANPQA